MASGSASCRLLRLDWKCLSRCLEQLYRQLWVGNGKTGMAAHISRGDSRPAFSIMTFKTYLIKIPFHVFGGCFFVF